MDMKAFVLIFCVFIILDIASGSPYFVDGDYDGGEDGDKLEPSMFKINKRSCLRRGSSCDHRPNDCCYNSACRCNLWGTNCRCQRAGFFQRFGRK